MDLEEKSFESSLKFMPVQINHVFLCRVHQRNFHWGWLLRLFVVRLEAKINIEVYSSPHRCTRKSMESTYTYVYNVYIFNRNLSLKPQPLYLHDPNYTPRTYTWNLTHEKITQHEPTLLHYVPIRYPHLS